MAQHKFALCAVAQFLWVASSGDTHVCRIDDRVLIENRLLDSLPLALVILVECIDIRSMVLDSDYSLALVLMA